METFRTKGSQCKSCFKMNDSHSSVDGEDKPSENDISICFNCGVLCKFDKDLNLQQLTEDEILNLIYLDLKSYILLMRAQEFIREKIKQN